MSGFGILRLGGASAKMPLSMADRLLVAALHLVCGLVLAFLVLPIVAILPLSFNAGSYLSYPLAGLSFRWYQDLFSSPVWLRALGNSLLVGSVSAVSATFLATLGALGLDRAEGRWRHVVGSIFLLPMIVPTIIAASSMYFFFVLFGMTNSYTGLIVAHTVIATPFVFIVVSVTLRGFDHDLLKAAANLGAPPVLSFRKVTLPLLLPGIVSGLVLAFVASFDDVVITMMIAGPQQRTVAVQMFDGVREQFSPTITCAATCLVLLSVVLLGAAEQYRRRAERMGTLGRRSDVKA